MQYLQPYVYQVIREIIEQRKKDKKVPYVAIRNDVHSKIISDIMETIGELECASLVAHSHNVNGIELYRDVAEDDNPTLQNL